MKRIHILKTGTFHDLHGTEVSFSAADLAAAAAAYDPALSEAPLVVGHPETDAPAYGWVAALSADAGGLYATPAQVAPEFAEAVQAGRYKKISASLYPPTYEANPKPGAWYLKHVGFLGGAAPAVKGLKAIQFADDSGCITVELSTETDPAETLWARVRSRIVAAFAESPVEPSPPAVAAATASPATPGVSSSSPVAQATAHLPELSMPEAAKPETVALAEKQADLERREAALKARESAIETAENTRRRAAVVAFVDGLVNEAKVLPHEKAFCVELLATLKPDQTVQFSEAGATKTVALADGLKAFLAALPQRVALGEVASGNGLPRAVAFAAPPGQTVDRSGLEVHARALAYQAQHKTSYLDAVRAVSAQ